MRLQSKISKLNGPRETKDPSIGRITNCYFYFAFIKGIYILNGFNFIKGRRASGIHDLKTLKNSLDMVTDNKVTKSQQLRELPDGLLQFCDVSEGALRQRHWKPLFPSSRLSWHKDIDQLCHTNSTC